MVGPWEPIWGNLGWVGTAASIFNYMVFSAAKSLGGPNIFNLGDESSITLEKLQSIRDPGQRRQMCEELRKIMGIMLRGIENVGKEAEDCRPSADYFDKNRIETVISWINKIC